MKNTLIYIVLIVGLYSCDRELALVKFEEESWIRPDSLSLINDDHPYLLYNTFFVVNYRSNSEGLKELVIDLACTAIGDSVNYKRLEFSFFIDRGFTNYTTLDWSDHLVQCTWFREAPGELNFRWIEPRRKEPVVIDCIQ